MAETAIIVPVLEAEPAIDHVRREHTRAGREGLPAHVTLLYPFTDGGALAAERVEEAASVLARFTSFDAELTSVRHFAGPPRVLYLTPEPEEPFRLMTGALVDAFPEHPPYGGVHALVVPHVTVAVGDEETLAPFEQDVARALPISVPVREAWLMQHDEHDAWFVRHRFAFSGRGRRRA